MNVLNITINKINAEKHGVPKGQINVTSNIKTDNVEKTNIGVDDSKKTVKVNFTYKTTYQPDLGTIELQGTVLVLVTKDEAEKVLDNWDKNKKMDKDFASVVLNAAMKRSSLQSIFISRELDLPSPIPLPNIKAKEDTKDNN